MTVQDDTQPTRSSLANHLIKNLDWLFILKGGILRKIDSLGLAPYVQHLRREGNSNRVVAERLNLIEHRA